MIVGRIRVLLGKPFNSQLFNEAKTEFELKPVETTGKLRYWENPERGISLVLREGVISSVMLFGNGKDDFHDYKGKLPTRLTFRSTRCETRALLGTPSLHSDSRSGSRDWDRYDFPDHSFHLTYSSTTGLIELFTLSIPERAVNWSES